MNKYLIEYGEKYSLVINTQNGEKVEAKIEHPVLQDEISLPLRYTVTTLDDHLIGAVISSLPEKNRIIMRNGSDISNLIIGGNEELILNTSVGNKRYDVGIENLDDFEENKKKLYEKDGFTHGLKIRSASEVGNLEFFSKDGLDRSVLTLETSEFKEFLPLILYRQIKSDIKDKKIIKKIPQVLPRQTKKQSAEDGPFVTWIKQNGKPRILDQTFAYQEQDGEKTRFFEYLDKGIKPVILNGPTGNGKSVLAKEYASSRGLPFYFDTGSLSFRLPTAIGKFVPSPGNPVFSPGSLTLAAIFGGVYVLEEMPPIPQDELTGLNIFLETMELPVITQFGYELIQANPNFKFIATGNFHGNYTTNELNDAFLQRFNQIKIGYPTKENTIDILQARAPGIDYSTAENITNLIFSMRKAATKHSKDLGLKGPVELVQNLARGTEIPFRNLVIDTIINPLTTYEDNVNTDNGKLYSELIQITDSFVGM